MAKSKPPRPKQDPAQHKRFVEMAREVEVDESAEAFDRAFDRVIGAARDSKPKAPDRSK